MQLQLNDKSEVVGFATVGGIDGGVTVDNVPDNFASDFKAGYYVLIDGKTLSVNPDYVDPATDVVVNTPSDEQKLLMQQAADITSLKQTVESQAAQIAELSKGSAS